MHNIGFCTGAINRENRISAIHSALKFQTKTLEISAHQMSEFTNALDALLSLPMDIDASLHLPGEFTPNEELLLIQSLFSSIQNRSNTRLILHPDTVHAWDAWQCLGSNVCIENMDHRKSTGRYVHELAPIFQKYPKFSMCFDIAHAYALDSSLVLARELLTHFRDRIREIHVSELNDSCEHVQTSTQTREAYKSIRHLIPTQATVIIESQVTPTTAHSELMQMRSIFDA